MKNLSKTIAILAIIIFTFSCSKNDAPAPIQPVILAPLQDPLPGYLAATGFNEKSSIEIDSWENAHGFSFIPLVNGKIRAIVIKNSVVQSGIRVTVWDKSNGTVLRTEYIDLPTAGVEIIKQITALELVKDKEYFLTLNTNDRYYRRRNDGVAVTYPFIVGDIKITSYAMKNGTVTQVIPTTLMTNACFGDCSFKFQKLI